MDTNFFSNSVLQQWGICSLTSEERIWQCPTWTSSGWSNNNMTMTWNKSWYVTPNACFNGTNTSYAYTQEGQMTSSVIITFTTSYAIKLRSFSVTTVNPWDGQKAPTIYIYGYINGVKTLFNTGTYSTVSNTVNTIEIPDEYSDTEITQFTMEIGATHAPYNIYCALGQMSINAVYPVEASNTCIFPISFSNTFYSHTLGFESGSGLNSFVSNKTISGMKISNGSTDSNRVSWMTLGF